MFLDSDEIPIPWRRIAEFVNKNAIPSSIKQSESLEDVKSISDQGVQGTFTFNKCILNLSM